MNLTLALYLTAAMALLATAGQLGDVLGESARIALSWVRAHATALGLPLLDDGGGTAASRWDVHIHLPAGAVS
jgi:ATP-dependent Lon protease